VVPVASNSNTFVALLAGAPVGSQSAGVFQLPVPAFHVFVVVGFAARPDCPRSASTQPIPAKVFKVLAFRAVAMDLFMGRTFGLSRGGESSKKTVRQYHSASILDVC
jgi:hypothetical protein